MREPRVKSMGPTDRQWADSSVLSQPIGTITGLHQVYVLKPEQEARQNTCTLLREAGLWANGFAETEELTDRISNQMPGCLVLALRLSGTDGVTFLKHLRQQLNIRIPAIIVTADGSVADAVACVKLGALDFLEKPADPQRLISAVRDALLIDMERVRRESQIAQSRARVQRLSHRERELVQLICQGHSSKQIALKLGISVKTVANHRSHLMSKCKAENTADLVRLAMSAVTE